ncbi:MAG: MxaS protein [Rubrivivax sp.]
MAAPRELFYRFGAAAGGAMPGHHRSHGGAAGLEFRAHAPLADWPDARRLDLHASLRDPFGRWLVRLADERRSVTVAVVADLSASMAFEGRVRRIDVLADFTESLAWSAWRTGDAFAFVGCDDGVQPAFTLAATRRRAAGLALAQGLRAWRPQGRSAAALAEAVRRLPQRRSLVFLVSDFHLPFDLLERVLASLAAHDVVPVRLRDAVEYEPATGHGLAPVREPESGRRSWLWWRPALRERWAEAAAARDAELAALFERHRLAPLTIEGAFDAEAFNRRFAA